MKQHRGFTIIELIITVLIVSLVLAFGIPSFRELMASNRITTSANSLVTALNFARSEAIKRNSPVTICPIGDGDGDCGDSDNWVTGWHVRHDGETLRVTSSLSNTLTLKSNLGKNDILEYQANGRVDQDKDINFTVCDNSRDKGTEITLGFTGRVSTVGNVPCN